MGSYVCVVAGGKGGVGRTTTAVNLGRAFQNDGHETVVVDADLGMSNVAATLGLDPDVGIHDVLDDAVGVDDALVERDSGLTVLPGRRELEAYAKADPAELRAVVDVLRARYDIVLVDASAGISRETAVPLRLSDGVILVTTPNRMSLSDTAKTSQLASRLGGDVLGSIVTRLTDADQLWDVREYLDVPTLGVVPEEELISATDEPITTTDTAAGQAYADLAGNLGRIIFEDEDPLDIEPVFEEWWVADEDTDGSTAEEEDEDEDEGGGFSLFG